MKKIKTFEQDFPVPRTHCGFAMGNGNLGAMVWGAEKLHITVNRADFWDHRGGECLLPDTTYDKLKRAYDPGDRSKLETQFVREEMPDGVWKPSRIPVGRFEFSFKNKMRPLKGVLDYGTGSLIIKIGNSDKTSGEIIITVGLRENLIYIDDKADLIDAVITKPSWEFPAVVEHLSKLKFNPPEIVRRDDISGWIQACPEDPSLASICRKTPNAAVISLELGNNNMEALNASLKSIETLQSAVPAFKSGIEKWWKSYWKKAPEINLPSEFFNKFVKYALFRFACATHPFSPIGCGLQGPWIEEYQRGQWSGDYHFNVNIQQIYTLAFASNNLEHLIPLFNMLDGESYQKVMKNNAKVLFGIDDGLLLTHAVDDRGYQCGWISAGSTLDHAVGGWTAQLYWLYYKYTLDKEFLKKRAYPFMYGIMRVYEEMLEEHDGRLSIPVSISAEYGATFDGGRAQNAGRDPSYQLACMHMLADALLESSEILDIAPRQIWKTIKEKVPPYTLIEKGGEKKIAIWEGQDLDICHRHHSHLACIYPFDSLGDWTEEQKEIIDNSIDHWILKGMGQWSEWCMPWASIIHSRLGLKDSSLLLLEIWKEVFVNEGFITVYLPKFRGFSARRREDIMKPRESNEVMQLDGSMGGATAIYEMLLHTKNNTTYIFPAVSAKWKDVSFKNIRAPGAFLVSAVRKNGVTEEIVIKSLKGGRINISVPDCPRMRLIRKSGSSDISLPSPIDMKASETITLTVS